MTKNNIAKTPPPPYYAVIFTSERTRTGGLEYQKMAEKMVKLAQEQPGYLGHESAREDLGITVSYWENLESIRNWKMDTEHLIAQKLGREKWYSAYKTRICLVERDYGMDEIG